jgi:hypothetical protein
VTGLYKRVSRKETLAEWSLFENSKLRREEELSSRVAPLIYQFSLARSFGIAI